MATTDPDRRRGDDWSLRALYDLVPDAYELDLLEEARRPARPAERPLDLDRVLDEFVAGLGFDPASPTADHTAAPSPTQARFMIERLLGGVVVDDQTL